MAHIDTLNPLVHEPLRLRRDPRMWAMSVLALLPVIYLALAIASAL